MGLNIDDRAKDNSNIFRVLANDELQYSLWAKDLAIPAGWREVMPPATKEVCLAFIREVWTDLRPASLRRAMLEEAIGR